VIRESAAASQTADRVRPESVTRQVRAREVHCGMRVIRPQKGLYHRGRRQTTHNPGHWAKRRGGRLDMSTRWTPSEPGRAPRPGATATAACVLCAKRAACPRPERPEPCARPALPAATSAVRGAPALHSCLYLKRRGKRTFSPSAIGLEQPDTGRHARTTPTTVAEYGQCGCHSPISRWRGACRIERRADLSVPPPQLRRQGPRHCLARTGGLRGKSSRRSPVGGAEAGLIDQRSR